MGNKENHPEVRRDNYSETKYFQKKSKYKEILTSPVYLQILIGMMIVSNEESGDGFEGIKGNSEYYSFKLIIDRLVKKKLLKSNNYEKTWSKYINYLRDKNILLFENFQGKQDKGPFYYKINYGQLVEIFFDYLDVKIEMIYKEKSIFSIDINVQNDDEDDFFKHLFTGTYEEVDNSLKMCIENENGKLLMKSIVFNYIYWVKEKINNESKKIWLNYVSKEKFQEKYNSDFIFSGINLDPKLFDNSSYIYFLQYFNLKNIFDSLVGFLTTEIGGRYLNDEIESLQQQRIVTSFYYEDKYPELFECVNAEKKVLVEYNCFFHDLMKVLDAYNLFDLNKQLLLYSIDMAKMSLSYRRV